MKICSLYGAGFYYMPGTDTCIKIGGFVRAEMNFNARGSFFPVQSANFDDRAYDFEHTRARFGISVDARTQTEFGTLRSYLNMTEQVTDDGGGSGVGTWANRGFIQLAGFTAGLSDSFFDFDTMPYTNQTNIIGSTLSGGGTPLFAYTAQFGNGFSASVSAEDTTARRTDLLGTDYAGREWPDFVANLRVDQAWGSAQIMGAVHQVRAVGDTATGDHPSDEVGWAAGAGLKLNVPMLGAKDYAIAQFTYAEGALNYIGNHLATESLREGYPTVTSTAYGPVYDGTWGGTGTDLDLTKGWSVTAGYEHHWVPNWKTSIYGAYAAINYSDTSSARIVTANGVAGSADSDWQIWQVGSRTTWTPVQNLDLSVEVMYNNVNTAFDGGTSATLGTFEDKSFWAGMFRVQRNFYP